MARHTLLIALLAALVLLVAHASASREEGQDSCRKQLKSLNLEHCERHLTKRIQKEDEDEDVLTMRGINYIRNREEREDGQKEKCCSQLSQVNILDCRCQAMQEIMESLSDRLQKREIEDAKRELRTLPLRCGIATPFPCDLSSDD